MTARPDIGARVLLVAVVPITLIAAALSWYFTTTRITELEMFLNERGLAVARQVARSSEYGIFAGNAAALHQLAESAVREGGVDGVVIVDMAGAILARSGLPLASAVLRPPLSQAAKTLRDIPGVIQFYVPIVTVTLLSDEPLTRELAREPQQAPTMHGAVLTQVSLAQLEARQRQLVRNALLIALGGLAIAVLLVVHLSRTVTQPVLALAEAVARIGRGDFSARAPSGDAGALGTLGRGINDMAASLDAGRRHLEARIAAATSELQQQKEAAEHANRTKTQFLAAASHDLRQPLQALGLFITTLRLRAKDPELAPVVERIERALGTLESVLEALLDISKLDAGVVTPRVEAFPVNGVLTRMRDLFAASAAQRELRFAVHATTAWCRSDPGLLERVLANLVANALRYTKQGGVVVACRRAGDGLRLEVWDTGIGIPADRQHEIFGEFVQLDAPAVATDKGLGLGLAIVDRLCRLLDHSIALRSVPGRGTVFKIAVPAAAPRAAPRVARYTAPGPQIESRRVLVIDDDEEVLTALDEFLRLRGAVPIRAKTLAQAHAQVRTIGVPDVILSDYRLGAGANGIDVVNVLRAEFGADIPAAILTGDTAAEVLAAVGAAGLPLLHKPVRPEGLEELFNTLLQSPAG